MNYKLSGMIAVIMVSAVLLTGCARPTLEQRSDWIVQKIIHELDLTKDQQTALMQIKSDILQKLKSQKEARFQLRDESIALVKSDAIDPKKLEQIKQKMNDLNKELQDFITPKMIEFHKTLSSAQKEKAAAWMKKMSDKMMESL